MTVGVGNIGPRQAEHTGVCSKMPVDQFGQLAVKSRREVVVNRPDLLFDNVKIIDQPLRRGRDRAFLLCRGDGSAIGRAQRMLICAQARFQPAIGGGFQRDLLGGSER